MEHFLTIETLIIELLLIVSIVAIVVQLAATRYTHRVTTLFVRDRVNQAVMTLFVLTTALCIWLALVLTGEVHDAPIVPRGGFLLALGHGGNDHTVGLQVIAKIREQRGVL